MNYAEIGARQNSGTKTRTTTFGTAYSKGNCQGHPESKGCPLRRALFIASSRTADFMPGHLHLAARLKSLGVRRGDSVALSASAMSRLGAAMMNVRRRAHSLSVPPFGWSASEALIDEECREMDGACRDKSLGLWRLALL